MTSVPPLLSLAEGRKPTYYERDNIIHIDGTRIFHSPDDSKNEEDIAVFLETKWKCKLRRFGALSPIDWFAERGGRVVGLVELKARPHEHAKFPTVFLNVRKWLSLVIGSVGLSCPGIFVVKFSDGVWWCRVSDIDASQQKIGGCSHVVKSYSDIEPVIEVPTETLSRLV